MTAIVINVYLVTHYTALSHNFYNTTWCTNGITNERNLKIFFVNFFDVRKQVFTSLLGTKIVSANIFHYFMHDFLCSKINYSKYRPLVTNNKNLICFNFQGQL